MSTIVVMPGGFHPFHAGHAALYDSARRAFPDAEVYVAATNDTSTRPFPFQIKEKLAKLAGVEPGHFVQVKSPFQAKEITAQYNPEKDVLIFVRSEKDSTKPPQAGGVKKDGNPAYLQPLLGAKKLQPFAKHAYMAYLPTVEFGPGMTSATEIRSAWPHLNDKRKTALVMSLYPKTQSNPQLATTVVKMLDTAMGGEITEVNTQNSVGGMYAGYQARENQPVAEAISRRGILKGLAGAGALGAAGKAGAIAGAFPTPSHQAAMYKAAADSNRAMAAQEVERQRQANAAKASKLAADTKDVERLNKVNYHGKDAPKPTNATWDGDSDFLDLDGTQYTMASRMPISGNEPRDMKLIATKEGHQVYIWTRYRMKGDGGHYFYPAEKPSTINEFAPGNGDDDRPTAEYEVYQCRPDDQFEWIGGPLMQTDDMGKAHSFAYFLWKKHPDKCFMIWQERSQGSRGGYGPEGSVLAPSKEDLTEFAPNDSGGSRKFIPWPEFIDAVKQIVGKDFEVTEKVVKSTIQDRFVPYDPMEYGPTMLYSYYEARAGRGKGAVSTRGSIQVGKYYPNSTQLGTRNFITSFNLLKGHKFERHFDLTFDNIYEIANIIKGNTEGAYKVQPEGVAEAVATKQQSYVDPTLKKDPELYRSKLFAKQHYPTFSQDPDEAFDKWVQRGLQHSEEEDVKHNAAIKALTRKIADMERKIATVRENADYLPETRRRK